jgi:hypothetical protein
MRLHEAFMTLPWVLAATHCENNWGSACGDFMETGFDNTAGMRNVVQKDSRQWESADEILQKQE